MCRTTALIVQTEAQLSRGPVAAEVKVAMTGMQGARSGGPGSKAESDEPGITARGLAGWA